MLYTGLWLVWRLIHLFISSTSDLDADQALAAFKFPAKSCLTSATYIGFGLRVERLPPNVWNVSTGLFISGGWVEAGGPAASVGSGTLSGVDVFLEGRPLVGMTASSASARKFAGFAFDQWWVCILSTPDLKVPTLTLIVEAEGLSTIKCGPV